jgi:hypothetical protein
MPPLAFSLRYFGTNNNTRFSLIIPFKTQYILAYFRLRFQQNKQFTLWSNQSMLTSARLTFNTLFTSRANGGEAELGAVTYNFRERFNEFTFYSFLTRPEIINAIVKVRTECISVLSNPLFNTRITKVSRKILNKQNLMLGFRVFGWRSLSNSKW